MQKLFFGFGLSVVRARSCLARSVDVSMTDDDMYCMLIASFAHKMEKTEARKTAFETTYDIRANIVRRY